MHLNFKYQFLLISFLISADSLLRLIKSIFALYQHGLTVQPEDQKVIFACLQVFHPLRVAVHPLTFGIRQVSEIVIYSSMFVGDSECQQN